MNIIYSLKNRVYSKYTLIQQQSYVDVEKIYEYLHPLVIEFIEKYMDLTSDATKIMDTSTKFNIESMHIGSVDTFINLRRINDIKLLNKFFESVNSKLPIDGIFIGCAETKNIRKERILNKYPKLISYPYYTLDFLLKRVFPKWGPTRKINFFSDKGK